VKLKVNFFANKKIQKAEAAAQKQATADSKKTAEEDRQWAKGGKSNAKKYVFIIGPQEPSSHPVLVSG
jgi:hypothetical protein